MSISSGKRHTFTNEENGLALDLFESQDNSIIASPFHGAANQQVTILVMLVACPTSCDHDHALQWITVKQDDGQWTLQSVSTQKSYVGFKNTPKDGTPLFGINTPQLWDIEILVESEDHDNLRVRCVCIMHLTGNCRS
jgi:hypothetical protein